MVNHRAPTYAGTKGPVPAPLPANPPRETLVFAAACAILLAVTTFVATVAEYQAFRTLALACAVGAAGLDYWASPSSSTLQRPSPRYRDRAVGWPPTDSKNA